MLHSRIYARPAFRGETYESGCVRRINAALSRIMSNLIQTFSARCDAIGVKPVEVLRRAGLHGSVWWRWRSGAVSPTLRSFEAAERVLGEIEAHGAEQLRSDEPPEGGEAPASPDPAAQITRNSEEVFR